MLHKNALYIKTEMQQFVLQLLSENAVLKYPINILKPRKIDSYQVTFQLYFYDIPSFIRITLSINVSRFTVK